LAHDQLTLAALEARLAGRSLATIVAAVMTVLLITAWLGLVCAVVLWLLNWRGCEPGGARRRYCKLAFALLFHVMIRRQSRYL
jgi:hypothetical protein